LCWRAKTFGTGGTRQHGRQLDFFTFQIFNAMKDILNSKNGLLQIILSALLALAAAFGLEPEAVGAVVTAVIAFIGLVREWLAKGVKFRWDSNTWTYLVAALLVVVPALADVWGLLPDLFAAIQSGNINLIIAAGIALVNVLIKRFGGGAARAKETTA